MRASPPTNNWVACCLRAVRSQALVREGEGMSEFQLLLWVVAAMQAVTVGVLVMAVSMVVVSLVRRRRHSAR